jgi:hypothetical protein
VCADRPVSASNLLLGPRLDHARRASRFRFISVSAGAATRSAWNGLVVISLDRPQSVGRQLDSRWVAEARVTPLESSSPAR